MSPDSDSESEHDAQEEEESEEEDVPQLIDDEPELISDGEVEGRLERVEVLRKRFEACLSDGLVDDTAKKRRLLPLSFKAARCESQAAEV